MKNKNIILFATLALAGCSDRDFYNAALVDADKTEIMLSAGYETQSRASDAGFADGDVMGIYVTDYVDGIPTSLSSSSLHADNVKYTYNGTTGLWAGATTLYWRDKTTPIDIYGYYPFDAALTSPNVYEFAVRTNQNSAATSSSKGGYECSDLLYAKAAGITPTDQTIMLNYKHMLSGVTVRLQEGTGFSAGEWAAAEKAVWIDNTHIGSTVDIESATVTADISSALSRITPLEYNSDYRAVVVPQTIEAGKSLLLVNINGCDYTLAKNDVLTYVSGKMHTFTLSVDKKSDSGDYEVKIVNESISQWLDDTEFRDGIVTQYVVVESTSGRLKESITAAGYDYKSITKLKVIGSVDYNDLAFIRDEMTEVNALNLYDVIIDDEDDANDDVIANLDNRPNLNKVILPKRLRGVASCAFYLTNLVGTISLPEGLEFIDDAGFAQEALNSSVGDVSHYIGELNLPSTIKRIGTQAFHGCLITGSINLPDGLESIGDAAFDGSKFTGSLVLPSSLKELGGSAICGSFDGNLNVPQGLELQGWTFAGCRFTGCLIIPEGVTNIGSHSFNGCGFKGELKIPSTVKSIEYAAFAGNNFSNIIWSENLSYLGNYVFSGNKYLTGTISVPNGVSVIPIGLFQDCPLITGIELHEDIEYISDFAFGNSDDYLGNGTYIKSIVCHAEQPPVIKDNTFAGLPRNNPVIQVPAKSISQYRQDSRWGEFKRITAYSDFICRPSTACALNNAHVQEVVVDAKGSWKLVSKPDWISMSMTSGTGKCPVEVEFQPLPHGSGNRSGEIVFSLDNTDYTSAVEVTQYDYEYEEDKVLTLQSHTKGNGIKILMLGDGWDGETIASGAYIQQCKDNMEYFFGLPPYDRLRDYFDVYAAVALSQEAGINTEYTYRDTRFLSVYAVKALDGLNLCSKVCASYNRDNNIIPDTDLIFNYILKEIPGFSQEDISNGLTILIPNTNEYPSSTYFCQPSDYWGLYTLSICPLSTEPYPNDARSIIQTEAGGYGFGKLASERISKNRYIMPDDQKLIKYVQSLGYWMNISLSGKMNDVYWRDLIYDPRYSDQVDIFEGGYGYTRNVFRSESNSCMHSGIPYYNAISRMLITKRVLETAGESFSLEDFYKYDTNKWGSTSSNQ